MGKRTFAAWIAVASCVGCGAEPSSAELSTGVIDAGGAGVVRASAGVFCEVSRTDKLAAGVGGSSVKAVASTAGVASMSSHDVSAMQPNVATPSAAGAGGMQAPRSEMAAAGSGGQVTQAMDCRAWMLCWPPRRAPVG